MEQNRLEGKATGMDRRRRLSRAEKQRIVDETYSSGESVSAIARRHDVNANQLFKWRQRYGRDAATFIPVTVERPSAEALDSGPSADVTKPVEIEFASGHRLRIYGCADKSVVRQVIELLR
jgi:transposase